MRRHRVGEPVGAYRSARSAAWDPPPPTAKPHCARGDNTIRPLPDRGNARRMVAGSAEPTATSRVGQKWGRREGLRWLSVGVKMPTGALGIPDQQGIARLPQPGSIVVVLGVGGSNPLAHPTESCPDQRFYSSGPASRARREALSGAACCYRSPGAGPVSCGNGRGGVGPDCARRPDGRVRRERSQRGASWAPVGHAQPCWSGG